MNNLQESKQKWSVSRLFNEDVLMFEGALSSITIKEIAELLNNAESKDERIAELEAATNTTMNNSQEQKNYCTCAETCCASLPNCRLVNNNEQKSAEKWRMLPDTKGRRFMVTSHRLEDFILMHEHKAKALCDLLNKTSQQLAEVQKENEELKEMYEAKTISYYPASKIEEMNEEIAALKEQIERLQQVASMANSDNEEAFDCIKKQEEEIERLKGELAATKEELERAYNHVKTWYDISKNQQEEIERIKASQ